MATVRELNSRITPCTRGATGKILADKSNGLVKGERRKQVLYIEAPVDPHYDKATARGTATGSPSVNNYRTAPPPPPFGLDIRVAAGTPVLDENCKQAIDKIARGAVLTQAVDTGRV